MSSNTNNLRAIIAQACTDAIAAVVPAGNYPLDTKILDEAIAAVLALLPEKHVKYPNYVWDKFDDGYNEAIRQTRRNLIGEEK